MKAIGYIRLSQEDQSDYSIPSQERHIKEYCTRNGLELLKIYQDNGENSYTFDRKAFGTLEKEIKQAEYLIVYHLDRFSRNMAEAMLKITQYLDKGIRIRDITEALDMDDYHQNTFLLRSMKFMVAESELRRIKERTQNGLLQAAMSGRYVNGAPVGYINARDEKDKPILLIDDEKAFVIRMVFREYLNGLSIEEIRRMIKRYGFTPRGNSSLQYILANPLYAGFIKVPATRTKPAHLVKGLHDPIISEQDYWIVQDRLNGKTVTTQNRDEVPLRGVLHCGCGRKFTAGNSKGKSKYYWYYVCHECKQNLSASKLHKQWEELLDNMSIDAKSLQECKDRISQKLEKYLSEKGDKIKQVQKQLGIVEGKIENAEEKHLLSSVSEMTYKKVIGELRRDQSRLYKELAQLNSNHQIYWDKLNYVLMQMSDLRTNFERLTIDKKHQFVNWVFDHSLSHENGIYRTPSLPEFFMHNIHTLKEKGLLELVAPVKHLGESPDRSGIGSSVEHYGRFLDDIDRLLAILVA